jgi:hypothetical protein
MLSSFKPNVRDSPQPASNNSNTKQQKELYSWFKNGAQTGPVAQVRAIESLDFCIHIEFFAGLFVQGCSHKEYASEKH